MAHPKAEIAEVRAIFDTGIDESHLEMFRDDAHAIVDEVLGDEGLSDSFLTMVERYVTAGLAELRDPRVESAGGAGTRITYKQSSYLERATQIDHTGSLRRYFSEDDDGDSYSGSYAVVAGPQ